MVRTLLARANVVTDRQIRPPRDRDVIEPSEFFVLGCSTVAAAHSLKLIRICAGANIVNRGRGKGRVEEESTMSLKASDAAVIKRL